MLGLARGGDLAVRALNRLGFDLAVSISGAQVLPLYDAIEREGGMRLVVPRSERAAAAIAEGYAAVSGRPAAVLSTVGVGVINELPAIVSAARAQRPVLSLSPGQPREKRHRLREVFQGVDHEAVFSPVSTYREAGSFEQIVRVVEQASQATLGPPPGPVHLDIPFPELFKRRRPGQKVQDELKAISPLEAISLPSAKTPSTEAGEGGASRGNGPLWVADRHDLLADAAVNDGLTPGMEGAALATPFAVGAALAQPGRPVALLLSAEDLLAGAAELDTAGRHGIELDVVIADDTEKEAIAILRGYGLKPRPAGEIPEPAERGSHRPAGSERQGPRERESQEPAGEARAAGDARAAGEARAATLKGEHPVSALIAEPGELAETCVVLNRTAGWSRADRGF